MSGLPTIPRRGGKNDQYAFGHLVLPTLLFEHPEVLAGLATEDPAAFVEEAWNTYARQWSMESKPREVRVRWYRQEKGGLAAAIDLPAPNEVPDPHGVLLVIQPVRAFFVIERTSDANLQKYMRTAWVRMSSDGPTTSTPNQAGFLCEWTADGGHRNYRYVAVNVGSMLTKVSSLLGLDGKWEAVDPSVVSQDDLASAPLRVPERQLPAEEQRRLDRRVDEIMKGAVDGATTRSAVEELLSTLHDAQLIHGNDFSEITLHRRKAIELMIRSGDLDRAELYDEDWRYFCHEYRGSRAPETAISYTSWARIVAADPRTSTEHKEKQLRLIHAMRDRLPGGIRRDLPGADDPEVRAIVTLRTEGA